MAALLSLAQLYHWTVGTTGATTATTEAYQKILIDNCSILCYAGGTMDTLTKIYAHPQGLGILVLAKLLGQRLPKVKGKFFCTYMYGKFGLDCTAGDRPAMSNITYCANCSTVIRSSTMIPVKIHTQCGHCLDRKPLSTYSVLQYDIHRNFICFDQDVQVLALEYLYMRSIENGTETSTEA